ncbi:MAG: archaeosortase/exosortase family protein [Candidatus Thermoplasmatota archaeon]|nr:archaeosortase/exosortase family protein [Candidatus Thermoplasmatota archaeon]
MGDPVSLIIRGCILGACFLYVILAFPLYKPLPQITAYLNAQLLQLLHISAVAVDNLIVVSFPEVTRIYELSSECSGLVLYIMFLVGIFIVPAFSLRHRLIALGFVPLLFFGNTLRVLAGVMVGYHFSAESSEFFHDTFGQIIIFSWVLVCFIIWLKITHNFPKDKMEVMK